MWACRPTRFDEGAAKIGSLFGRIYNPPLRVALPFFVVGAHFICARAAPLQPPWPPVVAARSWRHEGMPPYGVRRGCGGNRGRVRAADSRPYDVVSIRSVGRGAHTPPNQAAGIVGRVSRPVGSACRRGPGRGVRTRPLGPSRRSSGFGPGGRRACCGG